jgi:hypothetical protein
MAEAIVSKVGMNVSGLRDFSRNQVFSDAVKTARTPFLKPDGSGPCATRPGTPGWPAEDCRLTLFTDGDPASFNGDYALACRGQVGQVRAVAGSPVDVVSLAYDPANNVTSGVVRCRAGPGQSAQMHLSFLQTNGGFTDLKVMRPGLAFNAPLFNPRYLDYLKSLGSGWLRGMEWIRTNGSTWTTWATRTPVDAISYGGDISRGAPRGAPVEVFLDLCNAAGSHAWVNVWHQADDDAVRQYARLCKARLPANRSVIVEYSNEAWNTAGGFSQSEYMKQQGDAALAAGDTRFHPTDRGTRGRQWYAMRAAEVADLFRQEFAAQAWRVLPVLGGFANNPGILDTEVAFLKVLLIVPRERFAGFCIAPYFGNNPAEKNDPTKTADFYLAPDAAGSTVLRDRALAEINSSNTQGFFATCRREGVQAWAYEGGLGFSNPAVDAVNRDPRVRTVTEDYLLAWFAAGGDVFCWFVEASAWDNDSSYGVTDSLAFPDAPKALGIRAVAASHPQPAAAPPPPDPRDVQIAALTAQVNQLEADNTHLRTQRDEIRQLADELRAKAWED